MKRLILVVLCMVVASFAFAATGDKSKVIMGSKFSTYSTNRQIELNLKLPAATFSSYTATRRPVYEVYSTGRAVCWKANGLLGTCVDVPAANGACTCN